VTTKAIFYKIDTWNWFFISTSGVGVAVGVAEMDVGVSVGVARSHRVTLTLVVDAGVVGVEEATERFLDSSMLLFRAFWK